MLTKRIIPCLDVKDGRTVKGVRFKNLIDAGDPVELGALYSSAGADELVFLDITASHENRNTAADLAWEVAKELNIPFTIGGGINSVEQAASILQNGADKVSVNSAAVRNPGLINKLAHAFGSQAVVVAIDAEARDDHWQVYVSGGRIATERKLIEWAREITDRGAGEILFTSMNHDGMKNGFALEALQEVCVSVPIPVIASGGAGKMVHFSELFHQTWCTGALAASIFHYREIGIGDLKEYLINQGINMRI